MGTDIFFKKFEEFRAAKQIGKHHKRKRVAEDILPGSVLR